MSKIQKAGNGVIIKSRSNQPEISVIVDVMNAPTTNITYIPTTSVGGLLFFVDFVNTADYTFYTVNSSNIANPLQPITRFVVKMLFVYNNDRGRAGQHYIGPRKLDIIDFSVFKDELDIQKDIYEKTFDIYCEATCPKILFSNGVNPSALNQDSQTMMDIFIAKCTHPSFRQCAADYMRRLDRSDPKYDPNLKVGVIFMEAIDNIQVSDFFVNWKNGTQMNLPARMTQSQQNAADAYAYELIRLYRTGYIHGDTHLENAMMNDHYNYVYDKRAIIIDFGRTHKHNNQELPTNIATVFVYDDGSRHPPYFFTEQLMQKYPDRTGFYNTNPQYQRISRARADTKREFLTGLFSNDALFRNYEDICGRFRDDAEKFNRITDYFIDMFSSQFCQSEIDIQPAFASCHEGTAGHPRRELFYRLGPDPLDVSIQKDTIYDIDTFDVNVPDGLYKWVFGKRRSRAAAGYAPFGFYLMEVENWFSIKTNHQDIMRRADIDYYLAAGEIHKRGDQIEVNLASNLNDMVRLPHNEKNVMSQRITPMMDIIFNILMGRRFNIVMPIGNAAAFSNSFLTTTVVPVDYYDQLAQYGIDYYGFDSQMKCKNFTNYSCKYSFANGARVETCAAAAAAPASSDLPSYETPPPLVEGGALKRSAQNVLLAAAAAKPASNRGKSKNFSSKNKRATTKNRTSNKKTTRKTTRKSRMSAAATKTFVIPSFGNSNVVFKMAPILDYDKMEEAARAIPAAPKAPESVKAEIQTMVRNMSAIAAIKHDLLKKSGAEINKEFGISNKKTPRAKTI
jgi:hypothetical protein